MRRVGGSAAWRVWAGTAAYRNCRHLVVPMAVGAVGTMGYTEHCGSTATLSSLRTAHTLCASWTHCLGSGPSAHATDPVQGATYNRIHATTRTCNQCRKQLADTWRHHGCANAHAIAAAPIGPMAALLCYPIKPQLCCWTDLCAENRSHLGWSHLGAVPLRRGPT